MRGGACCSQGALVLSLASLLSGCAAGATAESTSGGSAGHGGGGGAATTGTGGLKADAGPDATVEPSICGDLACTGDETCVTCPNDCGQCPVCNAAPSCSQ